ncbi:MAG: metallophosphoesterase [Smithellaceae bacterium]
MVLFLLTFLLLYGGINCYAFVRADKIFHFPAGIRIFIVILLIVLVFAPLLVRAAESRHLESLARVLAYAGYLWMAFVFLFFLINISLEFLLYLYKFWNSSASGIFFRILTFGLAALISFVLVIYGYIDAQRVRVKNLEITTERVLPENGRLRIVQISDVHVGIIIQGKRLAPVMEMVKQANPDILVSTGDLLDGELDNIMQNAVQFDNIKTKYGKFAVLGNHEYYAGLQRSLEFTKAAGFELLRDEVREVAGITIFGADDIAGYRSGLAKKNDKFEQALRKKQDGFTLLLQHQPFIDDGANFNLQLSGHTHGGQIFPFRLITGLFFKNNYGYYELGKNRALYVSRGTGTWGPPVRIFAPPEITVIDLIGQKAERRR